MSKLTAPFEIIRIIAKHEPLYLLFTLPQIILNAALPILYIYFPKLFIDMLTDGCSYKEIAAKVGIYGIILLAINLINVYLKNRSGLRADIFSKRLKSETGKIAMRLDLKDIEAPQSREMIQMANKAAELTDVMGIIQSIISDIITVAGLAYIIIRLDRLFILLVAITLTVKIIFVRVQYNNTKKVRKAEAESSRFVEYLFNISFVSEGGAKEIRLNSLQNRYMSKLKLYRSNMVGVHFRSFRLYAIQNIITLVILALQSFIILWLLSERYIAGIISIADFTMYFSAVATLTASLSSVTELIGNYSRQVLNVSDYKKFINLLKHNNSPSSGGDSPDIPSDTEFVFENVSFAYPNTDKQILRDVNIKIANKEKLVIVGLNGAGKSTFIKLLCKFYRPTSGRITLNGVDIWDIPNIRYYRIISAVFQDYANLSFSIKENIAMSEECDIETVSDIINQSGLSDAVANMPDGYDTYLTKSFDSGGIELSGGQSQKIAIARALYKNAPVLILDEPTASLDPKAESEIYRDFFNMAADKTTIFISHRLAASTVADRIALFADGKIAEYGSHDELMKLDSLYAEMYRKQSKQYINVSSMKK